MATQSGAGAELPDESLAARRGDSAIIPIVREEFSVGHERGETGRAVRVRIESCEERQRISLVDVIESLAVERVPVGRYVSERTAPREEGDVLVIPVFETVAVVETRLLLKEEVRITRHRHSTVREEEVLLRREAPVIERRDTEAGEWVAEGKPPPAADGST